MNGPEQRFHSQTSSPPKGVPMSNNVNKAPRWSEKDVEDGNKILAALPIYDKSLGFPTRVALAAQRCRVISTSQWIKDLPEGIMKYVKQQSSKASLHAPDESQLEAEASAVRLREALARAAIDFEENGVPPHRVPPEDKSDGD